jgi:enoyl-CoA hydratase/carnithine racemase
VASLIDLARPAEGVAWLTLDRPDKKNALSIALRNEVSDALEALARDPDLRVLVIGGAGNVFSAGFDLSEFADESTAHQRRLWASSDRFHHAVLRFPLPVIAAVAGPALAGGFDLAVLADLRLATPEARFAHPEHAWADVVYRPLRELVGAGVARELVLSGRSVDAAEALRIGLVSRVVPAAELRSAVLELATAIAKAPRAVLERSKAKFLAAAGIAEDLGTLEL